MKSARQTSIWRVGFRYDSKSANDFDDENEGQ